MGVNKKSIIIFSIIVMGAILLVIYMKHERIRYGENVETLQSLFPDFSGIESCQYKVKKIGNPLFDFIGPSNYHVTAVITIDSDEMERIVNQYEAEKRDIYSEDEQIKIDIEKRLIDNTGIDNETVWTFNQEFRMSVLGWRYVGEVYFAEEENAVYIDAENL